MAAGAPAHARRVYPTAPKRTHVIHQGLREAMAGEMRIFNIVDAEVISDLWSLRSWVAPKEVGLGRVRTLHEAEVVPCLKIADVDVSTDEQGHLYNARDKHRHGIEIPGTPEEPKDGEQEHYRVENAKHSRQSKRTAQAWIL